MFSDTHCHLTGIKERGTDISSLLEDLKKTDCPFLLDAGTEAGDLNERLALWVSAGDIPPFVHFSAGIWPSQEAIEDRAAQIELLKRTIAGFMESRKSRADPKKSDPLSGNKPDMSSLLCAVGECGLDHYHNRLKSPSGSGENPLYTAEAELFEAQLEYALQIGLPIIVHSRDAFDGTLSCIKNCGNSRGVIHCYSYGKNEACAFLDRGWYISFSGSITYTKKKGGTAFVPGAAETEQLLRYIPRDRLLLETDAPYLAPVPCRGRVNTPLLIEHTYRFTSEILGITSEELGLIIYANAKDLFLTPCRK